MDTPDRNAPPITRDDIDPNASKATDSDVYGTITDTITGVNVHGSDNLVQLVCVIVGAGLGALFGGLFWGGVGSMIGAIVGVLGLLILSGIAIGAYRLVKRING